MTDTSSESSGPAIVPVTSTDSQQSLNRLPRVLSLFDAITIVVGSIIGSGVFLKASTIARNLPATELWPGAGQYPAIWAILSLWIIVGIVTVCGALALGELAALLPQAGGPYVYLREAYGRLPAFLWGWTEFWVIRTGSVGALTCATVISLNSFLELRQLEQLSHWTQAGLAISIVVGLGVINILGTRWGATVQNLTTLIKVGFLATVIIAPWCLASAQPQLLAATGLIPVPFSFWNGYAQSLIAVLWAYDGWINLAPVAEEVRDPQRNVPRALFLGMLVVIVVYVGANLSYHLVLPIAKIAGAQSPVASDAMRVMFGSIGGQLATVAIMCSTFGAANANTLIGPRIYFAMSRDGLIPESFHQIHPRWRTPMNAILLQTVWTVLLIVAAYWWKSGPQDRPKDAFDTLTDFVIFGGSVFYAMAVAAVFVFRHTRPDVPRPYRTWGYPITPALYLLAFGAALVSLLWTKPNETAFGSLIIFVGALYFFVVTRRERRVT